MNTSGFRGVTNGANVKSRPANGAEAEMPAGQKQYARFLFLAAPAHPVPAAARRAATVGDIVVIAIEGLG